MEYEKKHNKTEKENYLLTALRERMEQTYIRLLKELGVVSSELLKNTIVGVNSIATNLLEAGEVERERLRIRALEIKSTSTHRGSKTTQANLRDFIHSRGLEDIAFTDITEEFCRIFQDISEKRFGVQARSYQPLSLLA